ncbi:MAG: hypothetical protein R3C16_02455 [Hyphomonadaceae bacterium]
MRLLFTVLAALVLAQCAGREDERFAVGEAPNGYVIIGLAETADAREPRYAVLWRLLGPDGRFTEYDDARAFERATNARRSLRVNGLPGEFLMAELPPGTYALDSVFATLREHGVTYFAQGVVEGPERPAFDVRPGEASYLGIWELSLDGTTATVRPWRLDSADMARVTRAANATRGPVVLQETRTVSAPCEPHRMSNRTQRQIC